MKYIMKKITLRVYSFQSAEICSMQPILACYMQKETLANGMNLVPTPKTYKSNQNNVVFVLFSTFGPTGSESA